MANLIRSMIYTKGIKTKDVKSLKQLCVTIRNNNEERQNFTKYGLLVKISMETSKPKPALVSFSIAYVI